MTNIPGTPGNDLLPGTIDDDIINRDGDPVSFPGTRGDDTLLGNRGNDILYGGFGNDDLDGASGIDQLNGGMGNDMLNGGNGSDFLFGETGADNMNGGSGDDNLSGGTGNDLLDGGLGRDSANYHDATAGVTVNLGLAGAQNTGGAGIDTLLNIETLAGSNFNDSLIGNAANNTLFGLAGSDALIGLAGNDQLNGDTGNDLLDGGLGIDIADYFGAAAGVSVNLGLTGAQNTGGYGVDTLVSIEDLQGSLFNDTLIGNAANNTLWGLAGSDALIGLAGNDQLISTLDNDQIFGISNDLLDGGLGSDTADYVHAAAGVTVNLGLAGAQDTGGGGIDTLVSIENINATHFKDILTGNGGNNVLSGLDGNDTLNGWAGADTLTGGPGHDTYDYNSVSDSPFGGAHRDVITDFNGRGVLVGDQIDLTDVDAISGGGDDAFDYIGSAAFTGTAGELRYSGGVLRGDTDGDAVSDFEIQLFGAQLFVDPAAAGTDILL